MLANTASTSDMPINVMLKPASGSCNLRCRYCFYADIQGNRETKNYGMMSVATLEAIVKKTLAYERRECTIAFQGGEPTLAGLDFFRELIRIQKEYNVNGVKISNALQTNGIGLDDEWAEFFVKNNFLVGLSLDGMQGKHDMFRVHADGSGTFDEVLKTAAVFDAHKVEYNILTVVNSKTAQNIKRTYEFFKKHGFLYQQYIPCLEPFTDTSKHDYSLTPHLYATFLKDLFDLWYDDISKHNFIYIRYFENLLGMINGYPPESCGMAGHCMAQNVIEADGSVFPCDFYMLDEYKIGNLVTDCFEEIEANRHKIKFIENSYKVEEECKGCKWLQICRGGCRREREDGGLLILNRHCEAYKEFFDYAYKRLASIEIPKMR